jgi:hypothetical protein
MFFSRFEYHMFYVLYPFVTYLKLNLCCGTLGTAATTALLYEVPAPDDRWWWNEDWQGKPKEVLGKNLPQCHFVHQKSHMTIPGFDTGAAAVGSQRLTAWGVTRPVTYLVTFPLQSPVRTPNFARKLPPLHINSTAVLGHVALKYGKRR